MIWPFVAVGGALGSVLRWLILSAFPLAPGAVPWATLAINVAGSLVLGALTRCFTVQLASPATIAGLTVGLCGGFTTFSTFAADSWHLMSVGAVAKAVGYIAVSVALSIAAFVGGDALARWIYR